MYGKSRKRSFGRKGSAGKRPRIYGGRRKSKRIRKYGMSRGGIRL